MAELIWSPKSLHDLEIIHNYIAEDSQEYARIFTKKIIDAAITISEFPQSGRVVPEFRNPTVREMLFIVLFIATKDIRLNSLLYYIKHNN